MARKAQIETVNDYVVELRSSDGACTRCWAGQRYKTLPDGHKQFRIALTTQTEAISRAQAIRQQLRTPRKESLYRTARIATTDLAGMAEGEIVRIVQWHEDGNLYTVQGMHDWFQYLLPATALNGFVL